MTKLARSNQHRPLFKSLCAIWLIQIAAFYPTALSATSLDTRTDGSLTQTNPSALQSHLTEEAAALARNAQTSNQTGEFVLEWGVNLGQQDSVLETPFLKAGLEQSIKDYLNLQLKCGSANKMTGHSSFHSLSVDKTDSTTQKKSVLSGIGRCLGNRSECSRRLAATAAEKSDSKIPPTESNKLKDLCDDLNNSTLFEMFDRIFVSGLFFSYNADIQAERKQLEESLDLDFNVTFVPAKADGLDSVEEVELTLQRIEPTSTECEEAQCTTQKNTILSILRHFGIDHDEAQHECEFIGINCNDNDLIKYFWIRKSTHTL